MSNNLGLALLVLVSAALGVVVGDLVRSEPAATSVESMSSGGAEQSLERIELALQAMLTELRAGQPGMTSAVPSAGPALDTKGAKPAAAPTPTPRTTVHTPELNAGGSKGALLPAASHKRLLAIGNWQKDEELRRRWIFTTDYRALQWFGTPDEILIPNPGQEAWLYKSVDGRDEDRVLTFTRGRLTYID